MTTKGDGNGEKEVAQMSEQLQEANKRLEEETSRTLILKAQIKEFEAKMTSAESEAENLREEKGELTLGRLRRRLETLRRFLFLFLLHH